MHHYILCVRVVLSKLLISGKMFMFYLTVTSFAVLNKILMNILRIKTTLLKHEIIQIMFNRILPQKRFCSIYFISTKCARWKEMIPFEKPETSGVVLPAIQFCCLLCWIIKRMLACCGSPKEQGDIYLRTHGRWLG